jgi:hypothetical protein
MVNWKDIHEDFDEYYQQEWEEEAALTYQDALEWVSVGFEPKDYNEVKQWKDHYFTLQQANLWREVGLTKKDAEFAAYLGGKGHQPNKALNWKQLRAEFNTWFWKSNKLAQEYLDIIYPKEQRNAIKELNINGKNLAGSLDLSDFASLEALDCSFNQLTSLKLDNCRQLKRLYCENNQLTHLDCSNCNKLTAIGCGNNNLETINLPQQVEQLVGLDVSNNNFEQNLSVFEEMVNLKELRIENWKQEKIKQGIYNHFTGSLKPLQNLTKLERLNISNTDIDSGLEYLPDSVEYFSCSVDQRKDAKVKVVEEELKYFDQNLKKCKEFNGSARKWLDENYLENEREQITNLDISYGKINEKKESEKIKLKGGLRLKNFTSLEKLNCSGHQLTDLDLSDCPKLIELKCDNNKELVTKNLDFLTSLINLKELDISDCSKVKGSLKSLENMKQLEKISINHTNISEGLECLPESCQELNCELDYDYSSVEIAKQLSKFSQGEGKYDLKKWRIDQANNLTASATPLERLFVIRGNFKQFINKWKKPVNDDWFDKLENSITKQKNQLANPELNNELSQLQSPKELWRNRWAIYGTQFVGRGAAAVGAFLTFQDQGSIGGGILAVYPFAELIVSNLNERLRGKENKWNEFLTDTDVFLDNYHELLAVTKSIKIGGLGEINKAFKNLQEKVDVFLEEHDQSDESGTKNGEIDLEELIAKRIEFAQGLDNKESKLWEIVNAMQNLESQVIAYRQGADIEEIVINKQKSQLIQKTKTNEFSKQPEDFHNWKDKIKQATTNWVDWINSKTKGLKAKDKEEVSEATQEWFIIFPNLNPQEDLGFILWLRGKKSQEIENFVNPQWVKEKIATGELELNELRKEYQEELISKARIIINIDNEQGNSTASLISSQTDLLNRFQQEEIELQNNQQAQIIQKEPYGIPSSSK